MNWFDLLVYGWIIIGAVVLLILLFTNIRAPYVRHADKSWGPMIDNKWGWFIMELPALLLTPIIAWLGPSEKDWFFYLLMMPWLIHYVNRTLIFPLRIKTKGKKIPIAIVVNGYFLGYIYTPDLTLSITNPNIIIGLSLFIVGMIVNHISDSKLIQLRKENQGYQIPRGWLFEYISCPNHFGEIVEWVGYAILAWNMPAISFAVWTLCNLIPRTLNHHAWYREKFPDYPSDRKAVIPFIL